MFKEDFTKNQGLVAEAYQKGAQEISKLVLKKGASAEDLSGDIKEEIEKLNKKYHFSLEAETMFDQALKEIVVQHSSGELDPKYDRVYEEIEDRYLNQVVEEVIKVCIETSDNFYVILGQRFNELKRQGLKLNDKKIDAHKAYWFDLYNERLAKAENQD